MTVTVTAENFDSFVTSSRLVLLEFYAPWCRHCVEFEGVYKSIGSSLGTVDIRVRKVDSSVNQALAARFAIHSIPSLFLIKGNEAWRYEGMMSHDSIVNYARGGYERHNALPMWVSPMGPFGKFKGLLVQIGKISMLIALLRSRITNVQHITDLQQE